VAYGVIKRLMTQCHESLRIFFIDLVLIDQRSVGKRSLHLMDTKCQKEMHHHLKINAKKICTTTRLINERATFLKIND
jgi:hypothetical protein